MPEPEPYLWWPNQHELLTAYDRARETFERNLGPRKLEVLETASVADA